MKDSYFLNTKKKLSKLSGLIISALQEEEKNSSLLNGRLTLVQRPAQQPEK